MYFDISAEHGLKIYTEESIGKNLELNSDQLKKSDLVQYLFFIYIYMYNFITLWFH